MVESRRSDPGDGDGGAAGGDASRAGGMHDARVGTLIDRWLDGVIDPAELAEMEEAVLNSSAARREFWRRAGFHGLLHEAARVAFAGMPAAGLRRPVPKAACEGRSFGGLRAALPWLRIGLVVASCLTLVAAGWTAAIVSTSSRAFAGRLAVEAAGPFVAVSEGFEKPPAPQADYLPKTTDVWSGDETEVVGGEAAARAGLVAHTGDHMLQFVSGHPSGTSYPGFASEVWRFIDLDQIRLLAGSREIRVELSAWFNAGRMTEHSRFTCGVRAIATTLEPGQVDRKAWITKQTDKQRDRQLDKPVQLTDLDGEAAPSRPVASSETCDLLDQDAASWQRVAAVVGVPTTARYLLVHCFVRDRRDVPFVSGDGLPVLFVDDIVVTVEPARRRMTGSLSEQAGRARSSEK